MAAATEDIFTKLDHLSLLSKVVLVLETHTGLGDVVLAKFITGLGRSCETVDEFNSKVQENGAQMADYFVCTLFTIIHTIRRPKPPKPEKVSKKDSNKRNRDGCELYTVHKGRVAKVMDNGFFVQLNDQGGREGLVHVSQISNRRIRNAKDVVKRDQEVYVKVVSVSGRKLSLSMRDVNQRTGKDLLPLEKKSSEGDGLRTNPLVSKDRPVTKIGISGIRIEEEDDVFAPSRRRPSKRMSSPEKWELRKRLRLKPGRTAGFFWNILWTCPL
ncbi:putative pre-mRNA-splicing factor ATP-dependent RNA helicase DEAH5 [Prunus yedoensis var. nudiflora]|uniref:Putative pre-mRNA-splicing factor ATP-dependent RNA helicase DEAH5 n=1 Tax=Prunus yedoensis var. nudiflora TaxID=2094558 RepID=A0A314XJB5_PRUYE|nr:putative pre-mRNA-splicing factor ATP-dependent RNA helicase DEAH5 [Prunus yedoensis var. nudiflora]